MSNVSSSNGLDKRVPKLRFPEFSGDWHNYNMGQIYTERKESGNDKLPILTVSIHTGVSDGALDETELGKRVKRSEDKSTYKIARKNDLVFNMMRAWQGAIGTVRTTGMVSPAYIVAYPNDLVEPIFMDYLVKCNQMIDSIHRLSYGVTDFRLRLYWDSFVEIPINVPSLEEQNKIASFLTLLDKRIAKQRELVENLKSYKRGVLSAIFSRKFRFKKTTGESYPEWQVVKLCDMFCKITVRNTNNTVTNVITNSAEYGLIPQIDYFDKEIANSENTSGYYVIQKNDFVYNPRKSNSAPYGPFNCYSHDEIGIISPLYTALRLKTKCNIEYLSWYFKSSSWYRYIYDNGSQGVRHDRVSMTDELLFGIPILLPSDEEQAKIAKYLTFLNDYACSAERILDKMIKVKDNLVNEMFI